MHTNTHALTLINIMHHQPLSSSNCISHTHTYTHHKGTLHDCSENLSMQIRKKYHQTTLSLFVRSIVSLKSRDKREMGCDSTPPSLSILVL
mmetsp:Transcript_8460/g.14395  ORF Transcript_8460/g.14395 Transcript_8460/m.14395 type:complete len:91 (+) Transcript_8460:366-638(+)